MVLGQNQISTGSVISLDMSNCLQAFCALNKSLSILLDFIFRDWEALKSSVVTVTIFCLLAFNLALASLICFLAASRPKKNSKIHVIIVDCIIMYNYI